MSENKIVTRAMRATGLSDSELAQHYGRSDRIDVWRIRTGARYCPWSLLSQLPMTDQDRVDALIIDWFRGRRFDVSCCDDKGFLDALAKVLDARK